MRRALWRGVTNNAGWKLASLAISIGLWFAVVGEPDLTTTQAVPVFYRNLPRGLLLVSGVPGEVQAELRGPSGSLSRASLADAFAEFDLSGVTGRTERTFTLQASDFKLPHGVSFVRALPAQIRVGFDRLASRSVPIHVQLSGDIPQGYRLAAQEIAPGQVRISGPERSVEAVESVQTDPIDVHGFRRSTQVSVNAFTGDPQVRLDSPLPVTVKLTIEELQQAPPEKNQ